MGKSITIFALLAVMALAMFGCTSSYDDKQRERLWEMEERIATLEDELEALMAVVERIIELDMTLESLRRDYEAPKGDEAD